MSGIQPCQICRFATAMQVRRGKIDRLIGKKGDKSQRTDNECVNGKEHQNYEGRPGIASRAKWLGLKLRPVKAVAEGSGVVLDRIAKSY
jgi:hypothetical protein